MVKLRFGISLKSMIYNYNKERANLNMVKKFIPQRLKGE